MPDYTENHHWVMASTVDVTPRQARRAVLRGSVRFPENKRIDALEVYCRECRRPWDDVVDEPCIAAKSTDHLRGGPIGERQKRKRHIHHQACLDHGCHHDCEEIGCSISPDGDQQVPQAG